jgi:TonB family protein
MRESPWRAELIAIQRRTRRLVVVSLAVHVLLFLLVPRPDVGAAEEEILEIVWLEEPEPTPPAPPARETQRAPEGKTRATRTAPNEKRIQLKRAEDAPVKPAPQIRDATRDLVRERLASLDPLAADRHTRIAQVTAPRWERTQAPAPTATNPDPPSELVRVATPPPERAVAVNDRLPTMPRKLETLAAAKPKPRLDHPVLERQVLADASLSGPVADRPLLSYRAPEYPETAKREAVEGSVRLHFFVLPGGNVKENVLVEKTSGFADFDLNARLALLDWRFEPLPEGTTGEQWGTITLNYRLEDAR